MKRGEKVLEFGFAAKLVSTSYNIGGVVLIAVSVGHDARINAGGVAVPKLKEDIRHRQTRVHVDQQHIDQQTHALL